MDYARQQRDPARHAVGIVFVVAVHAFVIYALMTGLARQAIQVMKKPLDATIIEEVKLPPPPPPKKIEPPKAPPPPPAFVPPPDVPTNAVSSENAITQVTQAPAPPPPAPVVVAPPPPPPPPKPAIRRGVQRIGGEYPEFPKAALKDGVQGKVVARLSIDEQGNVTDVVIVSSDSPRYFDRPVIAALKLWKFRAEGEKYVAEQEINFKLAD